MKEIYKRHETKIRYILVGAWNTLLGFIFFGLLYYWLSASFHYLFILILSYTLSITNAYVGYKLFVFKTKGNVVKEYLRFYSVYLFSLVLNMILLFLFVETFQIGIYVSQAIIIILTIIISFFMHKNFSFKVAS